MKKTEHGSVLPLLMLVMGVVAGAMLLLGYVTAGVGGQTKAQTAADAAALAGASGGHEAAQTVAHANGAQLLSFQTTGNDTVVIAKVGNATKSARARKDGVTYDLAHGD